ncbi:hypothetical protein B0T10DRAFT_466114 [Thelonectria olida]|uniref:Uncharacterized protein n=1 Tax=Thelonectria olida TaxID=1576542 RepID=A0A9P8VTW2_9HYPO|nr:hypothetical protein B0T10DRAFT_466114 [Thelonectria olida]
MPANTDIATRALVVTLKSPFGGKTTAEVAEITGLLPCAINRIYARAIERGFDPNHRPLIVRDEFLCDAQRSGRPKKQTDEARINTIAKRAQRERRRDFSHYCMANTQESWVQEDKTDEEAWTDEKDEK